MLIKEGCQTMYHHLILSCDACDINPMKEPYFFWFWIFYVVYFLFLFSFFFFSWENSDILYGMCH